MDNTTNDRSTDEEAARWYARLLAADCTSEERVAFEAWRAADSKNAAAFAAAERLAEALAQLTTVDPRLKAMLDEAAAAGATLPDDPEIDAAKPVPVAEPARAGVRRRRARAWAATAAVAATVAAVAAALVVRDGAREQTLSHPGIEYVASGTRRDIVLEDGTRVHLDIGSAIDVRFTTGQRDVVLVHGRALFDVAHDRSRPFTVATSAACVTALGTVFQVDRTSARVVVTLAEGSVNVTPTNAVDTPVRLVPGEEVVLSASEVGWRKRDVDTRVATSWSIGRHVFRETPLGDALREINRYADVKVRLADAELAALPVSGSFAAGDSESIVAAFAALLPVQAETLGTEIKLRRSASAAR